MRYFLMLAMVVLATRAMHAQVVVNEVCVSNRWINNTPPVPLLQDNFGQREDWFELYNTTGAPVDISGWWLSNRPGNPLKWQVPAGTVIPANGYQIVFCSKRDEASGGYLHTDYNMNQTENDRVIVSDGAGVLVDEFVFNAGNRTMLTHSRGRTTDGAATWSLFIAPTPGAANAGASPDYPAKPVLTPDAGFYGGAQNVTMTGPPGATIRYTTDGSEPTVTSPAYTAPVPVNATTVIRAAAFTPAGTPGFVETNTYFIGVTHSLDVISASGTQMLALLGGNGQLRPWGVLEYFDANGQLVDEGVGEYNEHGQDSWAYAQRGVDWITRDEAGYNHAIQHQIFNTTSRDKFQRLIIKAAAGDNYNFGPGQPAHIRDAYVQALSQMAGLELDERTYQPCIFYVNGQYWGVYDVREKVDDHDFTRINYGQDKHDLQMLKTWGGTWSEYGGAQSQTDWNALRNYIMANDMGDQANFDYVDSQFNWKSLVDYFCINSYTVCSDWLNWNTAWWRGMNPAGTQRKWRYLLWDMDATFDHYANFTGIPDQSVNADPCDAEQLSNPGGQGHTLILSKLIEENQMVHEYYVNRYTDLGNTYFGCDFMLSFLDSLIANIAPEMPGQIARWGGSMAAWQNNVQVMRQFIEDRCVTIQDGMVDCYDLSGPFEVCFNVEPPLSGTIQINSINPDEYPFCGIYYGGINTTLAPIPADGFVFSHWEVFSSNVMSPSLTDSLVTIDILSADSIVAHFVPDVIHEVVFNVDPPLSGTISVEGFISGVYPYTDTFNASSIIEMAPIPEPGWNFSHWEIFSTTNTLLPSTLDSLVAIQILEEDSIVAHFIPEVTFDIVFNVSPPMGGTISVDGFISGTYPYTETVLEGSTLEMAPIPGPGWLFSHWEFLGSANTLLPSTLDSLVTIQIMDEDSIVAHFVPETYYELVFNVDPPLSGAIDVDGFIPPEYPYTDEFGEGLPIALAPLPAFEWRFSHWEVFYGNEVLPSTVDSLVSLTVIGADSIVAHFEPAIWYDIMLDVVPRGAGDIVFDGTAYSDFPAWVSVPKGFDKEFHVEPAAYHDFLFWSVKVNHYTPDDSTLTHLSAMFFSHDTVIAHLKPQEHVFYTPNAFTPNGDGVNDVFHPIGNVIDLESFDLSIFDRWGQVIFQSRDPHEGWDGTSGGREMTPGVYVFRAYVVDALRKHRHEVFGHVTLIR